MMLELLAVLVVQAGEVAVDPPTVLVLELAAEGVDEPLAEQATRHVIASFSELDRTEVLGMKALGELMSSEAASELAMCAGDRDCLAELADRARFDRVVTGSVGRIGKSYLLNLSMVDAREHVATARAGAVFGSVAQLPEVVEGAVRELVGSKDTGPAEPFVPEGRRASFVVLDFATAGVDEAVGRNLTQVLTHEIRAVQGLEVISRDDVVALVGVEKMRQILQADCDTVCLNKIGDALDADYVVLGQAGLVSGTYLVTLTLVDRTRLEVGGSSRVTEVFQGQESELIRAVRHAGRRLLGVRPGGPGAIQVGSPVSGASVYLDRREMGAVPLPPLEEVPPGRYAIRLSKSGYLDWQSDIYVGPGETSPVWAELEPAPEEWYEKWWVWTLVGVAAAGVATAGVVAGLSSPDPGAAQVSFPTD